MRRVAVPALAISLLTAACARGGSVERPATPECEVRFAAPSGFAPIETFEQRYPDRIGVRLGFRDVAHRELHVFAGIRGEFGEGLPDAGTVDMTGGLTGTLVGRDEVWFLTWTLGDRCDPRVVLGNGFSRKAFKATLVDAGLAPAS